MKKNLLSYVAFLLSLVMLIGVFAACDGNKESTQDTTDVILSETESESASVSETGGTEQTEESETVTVTEAETETDSREPTSIENIENGLLIENAYSLANGVNACFKDEKRTEFFGENRQMKFEYALAGHADQQVTYLKNTKGNSYIENTFDVFVKMKNGNTFYASKSSVAAPANIYRMGYYYYDISFEAQDFFNGVYEIENELPITLEKLGGVYQVKVNPNLNDDGSTNGINVEISNNTDPYIVFADVEYPAAEYQYLKIVMRSNASMVRNLQVYVKTATKGYYAAKSLTVQPSENFTTYYFAIGESSGYEGTITGLRLDFQEHFNRGDTVDIAEVSVVKGNDGGAPRDLSIRRDFLVYSDKMHHYVQVASKNAPTTDIDLVGIETRIDADTVTKLIVKDATGLHYSLEEVDWNTAEYAGFDIIDAGIFGYIMPADNSGGKLEISLDAETNEYIIIQSRTPENGTIVNSAIWNADKKMYVHAEGVEANGNDFYMGQRIYTDENHDFDAFIYEAYLERNPLTEENFNVIETMSTEGAYLGYDAIRGIYRLYTTGTGFNNAYYIAPNKHYNVTFEVKGDEYDRDIYVMSYYEKGWLECSALLDEDKMMLPVPIQVGKNFSEGISGERNLWNVDDIMYSETIIPMAIKAGSKDSYTLLNLYQNWGKYPLKQLSWIQYNSPLYHLSTGVIETNCILPCYASKNVRGLSTLPDHRAMSAPLWSGQPQHTSGGSHTWLIYTDVDGVYSASENTLNIVGSYGPIYADVTSYYISDDGNIKVSYNHMEFPQTDENRAFYEIKYEVVGDVSFADFAKDFSFYKMSPNDPTGDYRRIGYLDVNNEYAVAEALLDRTSQKIVLGTKSPYFSFYDMPDWDRSNENAQGYVNLSYVIYNYEFVIGGEKVTPNFCIINQDGDIYLSLDLAEVTLKAGDTFTINAIVTPWGSQELESKYDESGKLLDDQEKGKYFYDSIIDASTGEKYEDKNVRNIRENSCLDPLRAIAVENCTVIESVFLPKVKSADGKSATFTLTGGYNNCAVRVYGFDMLTVPYIEELVTDENGEQVWKEYVVCSAWTQDKLGNGAYYDGYSVHYDLDGTFSYAFIAEMDGENDRTFRVSATKEFDRWPKNLPVMPKEEIPFDAYVDVNDLQQNIDRASFGKVEVSDEGCLVLESNSKKAESTMFAYNGGTEATGQYFILKYRLPTTNNKKFTYFEFFTSTVDEGAKEGNRFSIKKGLINDGEWHILVIDIASWGKDCFIPGEDGKYKANFVRIDPFNYNYTDGNQLHLEYAGLNSNLEDIFEFNKDMPHVMVVSRNGSDEILTTYDPKTGEVIEDPKDPVDSGSSTKVEGFDLYLSASDISKQSKGDGSAHLGNTELMDNGDWARFFNCTSKGNNAQKTESSIMLYRGDGTVATGQYVVIKYRAEENAGYLQVYTSTQNESPKESGVVNISQGKGLFIRDGEWHILIIDLSTATKTYTEADGKYAAKHLRIDLFNFDNPITDGSQPYVDLAFVGLTDDYTKIVGHDTSVPEITFYDGTEITTIQTK